MDKLIEILTSIKSGVDYEKETNLISGKVLNSIDIANLIAEVEGEFDIEIDMEYMEDSNFESVEAMWNMIQEIKAE